MLLGSWIWSQLQDRPWTTGTFCTSLNYWSILYHFDFDSLHIWYDSELILEHPEHPRRHLYLTGYLYQAWDQSDILTHPRRFGTFCTSHNITCFRLFYNTNWIRFITWIESTLLGFPWNATISIFVLFDFRIIRFSYNTIFV